MPLTVSRSWFDDTEADLLGGQIKPLVDRLNQSFSAYQQAQSEPEPATPTWTLPTPDAVFGASKQAATSAVETVKSALPDPMSIFGQDKPPASRAVTTPAQNGISPAQPSDIPGPDLSPDSGTPVRSAAEMSADMPLGEIDNSSRESFVRTAYPHALRAADGDSQLAQQLIATAISEHGGVGTGRDLRELGFNVGGIQGVEGPAGSFTALDAGRPRQFAAYNNLGEGFRAVRDLVSGGRYAEAAENYRQTGDIDRYWREINAAGYSETPDWQDRIASIRRDQVAPLIGQQPRPAPTTPPQAEQTPAAQQQVSSDIAQSALDDPDKWALCGPVAAVIAASRRGGKWSVAEAKRIAQQQNLWDPDQGMHGLESQATLLRQMGYAAKTGAADLDTLAREAATGNTPIISTNKHYFILTGYDPKTGKFDTSTTGGALRSGQQHLTLDEIASLGNGIQGAAYFDNPTSRTPSVAATTPNAGATPPAAPSSAPTAATGAPEPSPSVGATTAQIGSAPESYANLLTMGKEQGDEYDPRDADSGPRESGYVLPPAPETLPGDGGAAPQPLQSTGSSNAYPQSSSGSNGALAGLPEDEELAPRPLEERPVYGPAEVPATPAIGAVQNARAGLENDQEIAPREDVESPLKPVWDAAGNVIGYVQSQMPPVPRLPSPGEMATNVSQGRTPAGQTPEEYTRSITPRSDTRVAPEAMVRDILDVGKNAPNVPGAVVNAAVTGAQEVGETFGQAADQWSDGQILNAIGTGAWGALQAVNVPFEIASDAIDAVTPATNRNSALSMGDAVTNVTLVKDIRTLANAGVKITSEVVQALRNGTAVERLLEMARPVGEAVQGAVRRGGELLEQGRATARELNAQPQGAGTFGTLGVTPGEGSTIGRGGASMGPKESWQMSREEYVNLDFEGPQSGSWTPKEAAEARTAGLEGQYQTLHDVANLDDPWQISEVLGRGYEDSWPSSLHLAGKAKADRPITVYRTSDIGDILPGAFVSESKQYALDHAEANIHGGRAKLYQMTVRPSELVSHGDPHEFIWVPQSIENAHRRAVGQAVLGNKNVPVEILAEYPDIARQILDPPADYAAIWKPSRALVKRAQQALKMAEEVGEPPGTTATATTGISRVGAGALTDVSNSLGGSVFGAAAGAAMPADSEEERRQNALTGAGLGLVGGPVAGRVARRGGGALATPGVGPSRGPRSLPTVEVLRERMAKVERLMAEAQSADEVADLRAIQTRLDGEMVDALNARRDLEPAIRSDVGKATNPLTLTDESADALTDAMRSRERVTGTPDELSGPVSINASAVGRQNAALPFDPASAAAGGSAGITNEDEEFDPGRAAAGMLFAGVAGRMARKPGRTFAFGAKPGERLEFNVKVVPLSSLITSHTDNLAVNRAFPSELQPRVRERAASRIQIESIMSRFDPDQMLIDTHTVDRGPMIVGPDNVVESGNGRSIALRRLAKESPEEYARYVETLKAELPQYGLTEDALQGIDQPVLVRERVTDVDRAAFASEANVGAQADMSPIERAMQEAGRLSDDTVSRIVVNEGQSIDQAILSGENAELRRAYMAAVPENERGALMDAAGNLNTLGLERMKSALLVRTYPGSSGNRLATAFIESTDPGIANVERGIYASLPAVARAEARIASGELDAGLSIAPDVAAAADVYARLRRAGISVPDYLAQASMFSQRETTPLQDRILGYFSDNARSPNRIRAILDDYADTVNRFTPAEQGGFFGDEIAQASKDEVIDGVLRRLGATPGADQGADLGRTGASGQVLERAGSGPVAVPEPSQGAPAGRGSGIQPSIDIPAAPTRPAARVVRPSQPRTPAADIVPATGGPEGTLSREGAPSDLGMGVSERPLGAPAPLRPRGTPLDGVDPNTRMQLIPDDKTIASFQERIRDTGKAEAAAIEYQRMVNDGASPEAIATFLRNSEDSRWWDRFDTLRYASMLSDPVTHGQNAIGSVQLGLVDIVERPLTALLDTGRAAVTRGDRDAFMSEGSAQIIGMAGAARQGVLDAAFIMAHGLRAEDLAKLDKRTRGFATNIPGVAPRGSRAAGAVDFVMEGPLRALSAADALFRGTFRGGHLAAEAEYAARKANGGKSVTPEQVAKAMLDPDVAARAEERAAQAVLQEDRSVTQAINSMRNRLPNAAQAALSVAVPYIKTPYNIVAQGVGMTPAGVLSLANDIRTGAPMRARERRVSRMLIGAGVMSWASWENIQGLNTGGYPESEAERSTLPPGWRPYSRKVEIGGETYYVPLALLGPIGIPAMLSVLATEQYKKRGEVNGELAAKVAEGVGQLAEDQTFLRSISDASDAISKGGNTAMNYIERQASQFSPHVLGGGGIGRRVQAIMGAPSRDPDGVVEAWLATLPYTADQVPARRDVIGRELSTNPDGLAALVPIRVSRESDAGVIAAFRMAGEGLPRQEPTQLTDPQTRRAYPLSREQQERWRIEFGQELSARWQRAGGTTNRKRLQDVEREAREAVNARLIRDVRGGPVAPGPRR